jgi:hypothetical protein
VNVPDDVNVCTLKSPIVVIAPPVATINGLPPAPKPNDLAEPAPKLANIGI